MNLSQFDYSLPKEFIAQVPLKRRDSSRLLVLHRKTGKMEHRYFRDLPEYLFSGDALVLNDTKVRKVRLFGRKETGGKVDALLLQKISPSTYEALLNPSGMKLGSRIFFDEKMVAALEGGNGLVKTIRFQNDNVENWIRRKGLPPLPPYIRRLPEREDLHRYQTVYARREGAVAAPTAGLHFTKGLLREIEERKIRVCPVTLHVGYGTFEPVRNERIEDHLMHEEYFEFPPRTAGILNRVRKKGGRIIAVGTTSCRVLETCVEPPAFKPRRGWTDLFIRPPYPFQGTDALLTNFHLPKSTLLMLVSAFAGIDLIRRAYQEAICKEYRFYSYGDGMLIL